MRRSFLPTNFGVSPPLKDYLISTETDRNHLGAADWPRALSGSLKRGAALEREFRSWIPHGVRCAYDSAMAGHHEFDPFNKGGGGAPIAAKAAVSAGCCAVPNADVASRYAT